MGVMNLLKGSWSGKVGETVGAKWKDKNTIRTYTIPSNPDTPEQQKVRSVFKSFSQLLTLFCDDIKYANALDTKSMTVRNAITKLNKSQFSEGEFDLSKVIISRGGLPTPRGITATRASGGTVTVTWTAPTGQTITDKTKAIVVVFDQTVGDAETLIVDASTATATTTVATFTAGNTHSFIYFFDNTTASKKASDSVYTVVS